ncbi:MAG: sodium ion-translocating decarboxylase beta subunit, partial [Oleiphilaceae bacterium]
MENILNLWTGSGLYNLTPGQFAMIVICLCLLYMAIKKKFEPLLLLPIAFGGILANIPEAGLALSSVENAIHFQKPEVMVALAEALKVPFEAGQAITNDVLYSFKDAYKHADSATLAAARNVATDGGYANGMLANFYNIVIGSMAGPLLIFMGVGAMTDFGPMLANPKTILLGAAAQFGIFGTVLGAAFLTSLGIDGMAFTIKEAATIGIIGGADGPTSIFVSSALAPHLLGAIAVAAYSYMALVPVIQPPIMNALTTAEERKIQMVQLRVVGQLEKILFPIAVLILVALCLPDAAPLLGMFCLGNLMKESGVVDRLSDTAQNALI